MKKFKRLAYIILIVIVAVLSLTIYTNASKDNGENQKEKVLAEIKYLDVKLVNILNTMNDIKLDNYNIITLETSKNSINSDKQNEEQGGQGGGQTSNQQNQSQEGGDSSSESSSNSEQSSGQSESSQGDEGGNNQSSKTEEKFELQQNQILTSENKEINWDNIKGEIEKLYNDLPSITMDMYQLNNMSQENILNFNKECDNLVAVVQNEEKTETLEQLTKVYDYLPQFLKDSGQNELYTTIVETKSNILKGYSKLDEENWEEISNDIKKSIEVYSSLLTNTNINQQKQSNISKGYIMINELQNAINLKDKAIFLIKYKNVLEEINNM